MRLNHFRLRRRKNLFLSLAKRIYVPNLIKIRRIWERYRGHKPKNELNRKYIDVHVRLLLPVLLAIELSFRCQMCQMCDLCSKFEEDRTKTAVAIVDDRYFEQTDRFYICPVPRTALDRQ